MTKKNVFSDTSTIIPFQLPMIEKIIDVFVCLCIEGVLEVFILTQSITLLFMQSSLHLFK